jgi:hypothetical protein
MRRAGATIDQIREHLKYASSLAVRKDLANALATLAREPAEEIRTIELARLDGLMVTLWPAARRGDLAAVDRILKVMERRAKLLGLDAPARHEVVTFDAIEAEIQRLEKTMVIEGETVKEIEAG